MISHLPWPHVPCFPRFFCLAMQPVVWVLFFCQAPFRESLERSSCCVNIKFSHGDLCLRAVCHKSANRQRAAPLLNVPARRINMSKKKVVVSLGHDALGYTTEAQRDAVMKTAKALADLVEADCQLTITHSNGPQVSMIHKAMTELRRVYIDYTPAPMCVCSAMSQGYVGYDIQNSLRAELLSRGISKPVSTLLTQVTVDPYDEAFYEPTKVIGRYMSKEDAETEIKKGNYVREYPGRGFRRVVAAPKPIEIVEIEAIRALVNANQVVIACGGGGIPVIEQKHALKGASAVIEKDAIAGKLASDLVCDELIILTGVECVYKDFGKETQSPVRNMNAAEAKEMIPAKEFGEGTMLPKIEAALAYLEKVPSGKVIITSIDRVKDAIKGKAGTIITA